MEPSWVLVVTPVLLLLLCQVKMSAVRTDTEVSCRVEEHCGFTLCCSWRQCSQSKQIITTQWIKVSHRDTQFSSEGKTLIIPVPDQSWSTAGSECDLGCCCGWTLAWLCSLNMSRDCTHSTLPTETRPPLTKSLFRWESDAASPLWIALSQQQTQTQSSPEGMADKPPGHHETSSTYRGRNADVRDDVVLLWIEKSGGSPLSAAPSAYKTH